MSRWIRTLKTRRRNMKQAPVSSRGRARPGLTTLEDRSVPALLTVLNTNDSGPGSLRDTLLEASSFSRPGADVIDFAPAVTGTISLASPLMISSDISIQGPGANVLSLSGNKLVRVLDVTDSSSAAINVTLSGLTVRDGAATSGAGISIGQNDMVSLNRVHVVANVSTTHGGGIDVANGGSLNVLSSTISGNSAALGGGLYFGGTAMGAVTLRNSTISNNTAGQGGAVALSAFTGDLSVTNSTMVQNKATAGPGGGIVRVSGVGTITLTSSIVWGNTTTAGSGADISTSGTASYRHSLLGNSAGIASLINNGNNLAFGTNPFITGLGNNGGTMPTHALIAGSPAIDKGINPSISLMAAQNGVTRTFGPADIGAFELTTAGVPTVAGTFDNVTTTGGSSYTFSLTYTDDVFINVANLSTGQDIYVNGPGGFTTWATFQSVDNPANGSPRVATYSFTPPGGMWDGPDAGTYTIGITKNAVYDSAAKSVPQGDIGQFNVDPAGGSFLVTNDFDTGPGSLRNAVALANASVGTNDLITFDSGFFSVVRTINLTSGEINITDPVTIQGIGSNLLAVSGNSSNRVFNISDAKVGGMAVSISGMILRDGVSNNPGGALVVADEVVTLASVILTNNRSTSSGLNAGGGAIAITGSGSVVAIDCSFTGNKALGSGGDGGAIRSGDGSSVSLTNCLVSGNTANGDGGGIYVTGALTPSSLFVLSSAIVENTTTDFSGDGGGIFFVGSVSAGGLVLRNSTVSGNQAVAYGGGVALANLVGTGAVQNCTIADNSAGAVGKGGGVSQLGGSGTVQFESTIVSGNFNGSAPDVYTTSKATFTTSALGSKTGINTYVDNGNNLPIGSTLNLGGLANNGGSTPTHMPSPGSLLIDHGSNSAGLTTDQRGVVRVEGVAADIGAAEAPSPGLPVASVTSLPNVLTAGGSVYEFMITYKDETGINVSTIDHLDIRITGPNGYNTLANLVSIDAAGNGSPRVATYSMLIPGATWDGADAGNYTISLENNQVSDVTGNFAVGGLLGSFRVDLPNTYVVTNDADAGAGSLRNAILSANITDATDTITFDPTFFNVARTIVLTSGEILITESLFIQGPGANLVTVSGGNNSRLFNINDGSAATSVAVSMSGMTLTKGKTSIEGGAIYLYNEHLTLNAMLITDNVTTTGSGAGIFVADKTAILNIIDSTISKNSAGIGNSGGGIRIQGAATVNITRTTISGNFAPLSGGGLYINNGASLSIIDSTISGNTANSKDGGGLYFFGPIGVGGMVIRNSTFSGNIAGGKGGAMAFMSVTGTPVIQNSTITSNIANSGFGGGIARLAGANTLDMTSTIVAGNDGGAGPDLWFNTATVVNSNQNLVGIIDIGNFTLSGTGNLTGITGSALNPMLGALTTNLAGTATHALLPGSPALNAGSNPAGVLFDQRGPGFNRVGGASADIGAYEVQSAPVMTGLVINDGSAQRSRVLSITVPFNTLVNFAGGNPVAAFTLEKMNGAVPVGAVTLAADLSVSTIAQTKVKLTFSGGMTEFDSLVDGQYRLTITAGSISSFSSLILDGNGDGTAGDNFVSAPNSIHRLFGDYNGNRVVESDDFAAFRTSFGTGTMAFDFDGDSVVDSDDFEAFRRRFGAMV